MIRIISNGSKWAGQEPDSIPTLIEVLDGEYVLDRTFEAYGNFVYSTDDGKWRAWGNFLNLSHVFSIEADTREELAEIEAAINRQRERPDYLAQPDMALRALTEYLERIECLIASRNCLCQPPHAELETEAERLRDAIDKHHAA